MFKVSEGLESTLPKKGLELIQSEPAVLAISDHRMPEMEGTEFLSRVQALKPEVRRIRLTGYEDIKTAVEATNRSLVNRLISKTWNDDDLRLTVREAIQLEFLLIHMRKLLQIGNNLAHPLHSLQRFLSQSSQIFQEKTGAQPLGGFEEPF